MSRNKTIHVIPNKVPLNKSILLKKSIKNERKQVIEELVVVKLRKEKDSITRSPLLYFLNVKYLKNKRQLAHLKYKIKLAVRTTKQRTNDSKSAIEVNNLTSEFILQLLIDQNFRCQLTNIPIIFANDSFPYHYRASIDRIDSNRGYTKDNVQLVCLPINHAKHREHNNTIKIFLQKVKIFQK